MKVRLDYGTSGVHLEVPDENIVTLARMKPAPVISDPSAVIARSLEEPIASRPLSRVAAGRRDACVVISDITRPVPNKLILPEVLRAIEEGGIPRKRIKILIGTGIHRPNLGEELIALVGEDIAREYTVINHMSQEPEDMADCGETRAGIPILINRHYVEADLKVLTGFIEPHLWAGYSGGRKAILPGISSVETMKHMHGVKMIADPGTRYGNLVDNPFHEAGLEVAQRVGIDFIVNVTLNEEKKMTGVFSGHYDEAHRAGCRFLEEFVLVDFPFPVDIAVTSGGGAPLDKTLYQTVKGISGANPIVREGGAILIASRCDEAAGSPEFTELLASAGSVEDFFDKINRPGFFQIDQWIAQEMYEIVRTKDIFLHTEGIDSLTIRQYLLEPAEHLQKVFNGLLAHYGGRKARVAVIPHGPYVITRLST